MAIKANIVDIHNEQIFYGSLSLENGKIATITKLQETPKAGEPYIMPGFVDSHIHIESTLMMPSRFAPLALRQGTLAAVCDPHEIANVLGEEGIDLMVEDGTKSPFHFHFMVPSCVPSTSFETAGATLDATAVRRLLQRDDMGGLAEMMNAPGVLFSDSEVMAKIGASAAVNKPIDGHAPGLHGDQARQYVQAGISTDHECTTIEEAEERISLGMKILIREGSAACDFENLSPLLANHKEMLMFCTDDKYADELLCGHINEIAARAVAKGLPLWNILRAACVTPVRHYGIKQGLLQEGDNADFIIVNNLKDFAVQESWIEGKKVYSPEIEQAAFAPLSLSNNFKAEIINPQSLQIPAKEGAIKVMCAEEGSLLTRCEKMAPRIENGLVTPDIKRDILKIVVLNRYEAHAQPAVGFIKGFHLKKGALASTIAHDSHNIVAIGCDDASITLAINSLIEKKGGLAVTDGENLETLALPIAGLMSDQEGTIVGAQHQLLKKKAHEIGCPFAAPFMTMAFMALPVIPELKITDRGLFDGIAFKFTQLFNKE